MTAPLREPGADGVRCGVGVSADPELESAIQAAVAAAASDLNAPATAADLAVVFVSSGYGHAIRPALEGLADAIGAKAVIGGTAEAILGGDQEYEEGPAVVVWLARLPGAVVVPLALEYTQTPDGGMFVGWPPELDAGWPADATLLLLADPFSFPVDGLIKRLAEDQPGVPIIGGMASGGMLPGSNTLVVGPRSYDSGAVGVVIGGGVRVRPVVSQGCRPIGRPLVITKSEENLIIELGGRPALERLREIYATLDPADRDLVRSSLHVGRAATEYKDEFRRGDFLVRNVAGADPDSGVLAIGDTVRTGQTIQFHVRDAATAHEDLSELLDTQRQSASRPAGALVFTCNGRGRRLFTEPHHDARCLQERLGPVPAAGFFAQGEIGPIGRLNCLHGFTASIALFEAGDAS
jgi:small ligand-binding sensory domain FIST